MGINTIIHKLASEKPEELPASLKTGVTGDTSDTASIHAGFRVSRGESSGVTCDTDLGCDTSSNHHQKSQQVSLESRDHQNVIPRKASIHAGSSPLSLVSRKNGDIECEYEFPMPHAEESLIRQYQAQTGVFGDEQDHVIHYCQINLLDRDYYLRQAWDGLSDKRITCMQCQNRLHDGRCVGVPAGNFPRGAYNWRPDASIKRRCEYFMVTEGGDHE